MIKEIVIFLRRHWVHGVLLLPGIMVLMFVHECSHALAILVQGGEVTQFVCIPSAHEMGHVQSHNLPVNSSLAHFFVSIAPYIVWCCTCITAFVISQRRLVSSFAATSTVFVWLFLLPVADIFNAVLSYLFGNPTTDFRNAFGWPPLIALIIVIATAGTILAIVGYETQKRLYREESLSVASYAFLGTVAFLLFTVIKIMRWGIPVYSMS